MLLPKATYSNSYIHWWWWLQARCRPAHQAQFKFSILLKDTSTCRPEEPNQRPSSNKTPAPSLSHNHIVATKTLYFFSRGKSDRLHLSMNFRQKSLPNPNQVVFENEKKIKLTQSNISIYLETCFRPTNAFKSNIVLVFCNSWGNHLAL